MSVNRPDPLSKRDLVVSTPPQLSAVDVALLRVHHTQPPVRSTPMANRMSPQGRTAYCTLVPADGMETPRRRSEELGAEGREVSTGSGAFSNSLPYSWTDSYLDESPTQMRQRWMTKQTFGPVLQSEGGYSTALSTPYTYQNPEDVWGRRGGGGEGDHSPVRQRSSEASHDQVAKPLSFISQASTMVVPAQAGKRRIVPTRQPNATSSSEPLSLARTEGSAPLPDMPSPTHTSPPVSSPAMSSSTELPRLDSKRSLGRGLARGRAVHAIIDDEEGDIFQ